MSSVIIKSDATRPTRALESQQTVLWETSSSEYSDDDHETLYVPHRRSPAPPLTLDLPSLGLATADESVERPISLRIDVPDTQQHRRRAEQALDHATTEPRLTRAHSSSALQELDDRIKSAVDAIDRKCNRYICCCILLILLAGCIAGIVVYLSKQ